MQNVPLQIFHDVAKGKFCDCVITFKIDFATDERKPDRNEVEIAIFTCLNDLHGQRGTAYEPTLITYDEENSTGRVKISSGGVLRLWSALTLANKINGERCAFRLYEVRPCDYAEESPDGAEAGGDDMLDARCVPDSPTHVSRSKRN